ncbi:hypothetical protein CVM52_06915 [Pseudooceanicola lipolyticus]|uniref:DUF4268 domain-containing protein n=1 Tax=Pseudooceanicola lipolyticus TaxID=2029104 RepID=A0A2M8J3Y5_9RHOB|nr:hypothetical protein [Pseudooceanicola lipolyticus]PJE37489.1 hypothetical protein CVM52_06915 [Pseudooceanicola lipolyticus]
MTDIKFGRLEDLPLREAWKHEALQFTPWLAENIEHLSEAIGVQLELTGTEVAVETFSADILARDLDGNVVLIENQLEQTDHTHLGQIMTYLAGLEAQTVIWIAPAFREPHLSAIRWLNEHTSDGFSFFAIKARVVRIGDSPYAPIFEVIEKPSAWERSLTQTRKDAETGKDAFSDVRTAFWTRYLERHPEAEAEGIKVQRGWNRYTRLADGDVLISVWIGEKTAGIYVRGGWGERKHSAADRLGRHADILARKLGFDTYNPEPNGHLFGERLPKSYQDESNWPEIIDWMEERRKLYVAAISEAIEAEQ